MSQPPEIPDLGDSHLRRALATLPAHEPDPTTWAHLEACLEADAALWRVLPTLPAHEPDDDLWATISSKLQAVDYENVNLEKAPALPALGRPLWPLRTTRRVWALAASLLVLLGVGWWQLRPAALVPTVAHETVTFSQEVGLPQLPTPAADPLEQQGLSFIEAHCAAQPAVCQSGEFRTLRTQLQEVEVQEAQLHQAARRFGSSPELLREQARLVTLKAAFTRQLVHLLIS